MLNDSTSSSSTFAFKLIPLSDVRQNSLFLMLLIHDIKRSKNTKKEQEEEFVQKEIWGDVHFTCEHSIVHL